MWLPGVPCTHQNNERMSISSQSFPVISEVELWSLGVSLSLDRRTCPSVSCHPPASSTAQLCSPSSACTSVPSCYPSLLVFTTLILLDHLTQDATAAWRMYDTFLSGCFRVAQGKTEKHVVPTSVRERRNGDSLRAFLFKSSEPTPQNCLCHMEET